MQGHTDAFLQGGMWGIMNRYFSFALAGALLANSASVSVANEWWQNTFIKESSGTCEDNDSIRTFTAKSLKGWEINCKITKQQKIKNIDAVILDYECGGNDMDPEVTTPRELIVKEQDGIRIYPSNPEGGKFQACSSIKTGEAQSTNSDSKNAPEKKREERLAITNNWYHLEGQDPDGFSIFRKYTVDTSAKIPNRNLLMFRCSKTNAKSYLTIFVPYRFDLPALYGQQKIAKKRFMFVVTDANRQSHTFNLNGEVDQNQIYFDYSSDDKGNFDKLLNARIGILYLLDQNVPMQWVELGDTKAWPSIADNNVKQDFDTWTKDILDRVGKTTALTNAEFKKACPEVSLPN
ncbi:hypothetical protein [Ochrobactrum teleogrylli]|uniref:Uncharacterized protein n=1 Tax=Ochrobactrum teleogrylli TaxID=2479765 RepID=A0ABD5JSY1_9HYPH